MSKIAELIDSIERFQTTPEPIDRYWYYDIKRIIEEYAEYYCEQFRQNILDTSYYSESGDLLISVNQVTELPLPEHE